MICTKKSPGLIPDYLAEELNAAADAEDHCAGKLPAE